MIRQPFVNFNLGGVDLCDFGLEIPSPFCSLSITNAEIHSFSTWELRVTVVGDGRKRSNIAAFEALLYSASQSAAKVGNPQRVPVSFMFGWMNHDGTIGEHISYQGFFLTFKSSTNGLSMTYTVTGNASIGYQAALPVYHVPAICGIVKPSAVVEAFLKAIKADHYYDLDIDHNDAPTMVNCGAMTTSVNSFIRGNYSADDNYSDFPGLLKLSKSYSATRDAAGLIRGYRKISTILNNATVTPTEKFLIRSMVDYTYQHTSFSYWVEEPTMTQNGRIYYKSNAGLISTHMGDTLEYGTSNTNILSLSGSYNGVAYNMTNMDYADVGFSVDGSGNTIVQADKIVDSWSATLADVFQTVNIINDVNALASQFSGDFTVELAGSVKQFGLAQPVSLLVVAGNTISPVTGVYRVVSVEHKISNTFTTTLKIQRLDVSSANEVATTENVLIQGNPYYQYAYTQTSNIKSTDYVDFGEIFPTFEEIQVV